MTREEFLLWKGSFWIGSAVAFGLWQRSIGAGFWWLFTVTLVSEMIRPSSID